MKKVLRLISVILCLVIVISTFYGCTVTINVDVSREGGAVQVDATVPTANQSAITQGSTQAPTQSAATTAAANPSASDATTDAPSAQTGDTTAAQSGDTTAAQPAENAVPSTKEEIVAEYIKVYNTTKATGTFLGNDSMSCESVAIDGKENSMLRGIADKFMTANATDMQLPPYTDSDPAKECLITADDIETAEYKDNGDGTATIKLVPKEAKESRRLADSQGKMFNVMEDVAASLASVPVLTWSEGDANSNVVLTEKEGYAIVTFNTETKMMTSAEYVLVTYADVTHANVLMFKDKSAGAKFVYTTKFPQG